MGPQLRNSRARLHEGEFMLKRVALLTITFAALVGNPVFAQQCLHGSGETAEQATRRKDALTATRNVNNLQANQPGAVSGNFLQQVELSTSPFAARSEKTIAYFKNLNFTPGADLMPGWQLTLSLTTDGYWFMVKDKTDPCGFAYISNQAGLIFSAEPIR
jgi:hypothetical protein